MNTELYLAVVALALQAVALFVWIVLCRRIERWVWVVVFIGFVTLAVHRIAEVIDYDLFPQFGHITAALIALVALVSVLQTRHWICKRERLSAGLAVVQTKLEELAIDAMNRQPIATRIAEILSELREQIDYYETQAKQHHLPTFKNGGTNRHFDT